MTSPVNSKSPAAFTCDSYASTAEDRAQDVVQGFEASNAPKAEPTGVQVFDQHFAMSGQTQRQASLHKEMDAIEGAKFLIANDPNIQALLETVPESVRTAFRPKLIQQKIACNGAQNGVVLFDILNYTNHSVEFDESLNLKIDGKIPKQLVWQHELKFTPDSCQLVAFEYLGQLYVHDKDLPKNGAPVNSTRVGTLAFNFTFNLIDGGVRFERARLEEVEAIAPKAMQEFKKRIGLMFPDRSIDEKEIKLISAESFIFPDVNLGCPTDALAICPQVWISGSIFTFSYFGGTYHLHTDKGVHFLSPDLRIENYTSDCLDNALKILSDSVQKKVSYTQVKIKEVKSEFSPLKSYEECKDFDEFFSQPREKRYLFVIEFEGKEHRIIFNEDGQPRKDMPYPY